jgi:hypothetical protein
MLSKKCKKGIVILMLMVDNSHRATLAQLVEQRFCKPWVIGSSPIGGSIFFFNIFCSCGIICGCN